MMEFDVLRTAASGMDAQRTALDVAARNVAAAEVDSGKAFTRLVPRFAVSDASADDTASDLQGDMEGASGDDESDDSAASIRFLGTQSQRGMNADAVTEMIAVLDAQRAYEANASVFEDTKRLMERTIDLGRL
jgi:flagellar basal-body rod protein FlgC